MTRITLALAAALLIAPAAARAGAQRVVFDGPSSARKWTLRELNPELPSDWSGYNYLVLELKASSPQRFVRA